MKHWTPRWSVRTLAVVLTVACCYAACWTPTKRFGVRALAKEYELSDAMHVHFGPVGLFQTAAAAPLIVRQDEIHGDTATRRYYLWVFGYIVKLPHQRRRDVNWETMPVDFNFLVD